MSENSEMYTEQDMQRTSEGVEPTMFVPAEELQKRLKGMADIRNTLATLTQEDQQSSNIPLWNVSHTVLMKEIGQILNKSLQKHLSICEHCLG